MRAPGRRRRAVLAKGNPAPGPEPLRDLRAAGRSGRSGRDVRWRCLPRSRPALAPAAQLCPAEPTLTVVSRRCRTTTRPRPPSWGEPDFRGGWPIATTSTAAHAAAARPQVRQPRLPDRREFAERDQAVQALAQRYENEDKQGDDGHRPLGRSRQRQPPHELDHRAGQRAAAGLHRPRASGSSSAMRSTWKRGQPFDIGEDDFDSWDRCITRGLPASMFPFMYNNGMQHLPVAGRGRAADGDGPRDAPHPDRRACGDLPAEIHNWLGESRGRWENGNTLVVETTQFPARARRATNIGTTGSPPRTTPR